MMKRLLPLLFLAACETVPNPTPGPGPDPTPTPQPPPSTTFTPVWKKFQGEHVSEFADYKIDSKGVGHLITTAASQFRYRTFDGKGLSSVEALPFPYKTNLARMTSPKITGLGDEVFLVWGPGKGTKNGIYYARRSGGKWSQPVTFMTGVEVEQLEVLTYQNQVYLALFQINSGAKDGMNFFKWSGSGWTEIASGIKGGGKPMTSHEQYIFASFGDDAQIFDVTSPRTPQVIKAGSLSGYKTATEQHLGWPYVSEKQFPGDVKPKTGSCLYYGQIKKTRCWWVSALYYRGQSDLKIRDIEYPGDEIMKNSYKWPVEKVTGGFVGGHSYVAYDLFGRAYLSEVQAGKVNQLEIGLEAVGPVRSGADRMDIILRSGLVISLQRP